MVLRSERRHRLGLVEPHIGIELLGKDCLAVVAPQLRVGPVDDADEALKPRLREAASQRLVLGRRKIKQEPVFTRLMAQPLIAIRAGGI
jgi:hypothetical protein